MFCGKCGKQLPDDAEFCGGCGQSLKGNKSGAVQMQPKGNGQSGTQSNEEASTPQSEEKLHSPISQGLCYVYLAASGYLLATHQSEYLPGGKYKNPNYNGVDTSKMFVVLSIVAMIASIIILLKRDKKYKYLYAIVTLAVSAIMTVTFIQALFR